MGSLILKIDGKIESLPTVFKLFDLEKHINKFNVNVAPIPPIVIKPAVKTASFVAILVADKPCSTAAIFAAMPAIKIGVLIPFHNQ